MRVPNKLGSMVQKYPIELGPERAILYVRGMNVAEYIDLSIQGDLRLSDKFFMRLAYSCIVGWKGISVENDNGLLTEKYDPEYLNSLPEEVLLNAGKFIYHELSEV